MFADLRVYCGRVPGDVIWFFHLSVLMKNIVTIQMKASEQYFPVVLFIMLYKVVLTFESVDEILQCDQLNESYQERKKTRGLGREEGKALSSALPSPSLLPSRACSFRVSLA